MGVDRNLLYGSAPGGAHRIIIARGQPPEALPPLPFAARSIFVENPSGVWYLVNGFTVPPWTWGLVNRLDVPTASVAVARLTTPDVLISEDYGADMTIVAYEDALTPSLGRSLYPPPHDVLRTDIAVVVTEAVVTLPVLAAVAGRRLVIVGAALNARAGPNDLRALVQVTWAAAGQALADAAISPESPHVDARFAERPLPEGVGLDITVLGQTGAGRQSVETQVEHYLALP